VASATTAAAPGGWVRRSSDLILPLAIIASVMVIMVPLPAALMDVLLAGNIAVAVLVLLTTIYVRTPLEFSIFPSLLLATTLARLVLNVATTRLILTQAGHDGVYAAGRVVTTFSNFVAGNNLVVGLIIFAIIVVIQFVVITKGATRISEVAARFALDGMPGRQMAIDADFSAGAIDQHEAQSRRAEIAGQADFYGAMDGASKFVRGDAIAGLFITLINIVGGLVIGVGEMGMSFGKASSLFTQLTIGDGLVSQLPALLISLAAGLLVTRSTQRANLPREFVGQLFARPQALAVTGAFLALLVCTSLPKLPLLTLGGACLGLAHVMTRRETHQAEKDSQQQAQALAQAAQSAAEHDEQFLLVEPMEIELGVGLVRLADPNRGGDLLQRVQGVRRHIAGEIGILMPKVRMRDNIRLEPNQYRIKLADLPVAQGELDLHGARAGEAGAALVGHLTEVCRRHADELLTRDATKHLIEQLRATSPAVVDELIPHVMTLAEVQAVLQLLLREQVSVRPLGLILEALGDHASHTKSPVLLAEQVRQRMARQICGRYCDPSGELHVVTLDPALEDRIRDSFADDEQPLTNSMPPSTAEAVCRQIRAQVAGLSAAGRWPVVLVSPPLRVAVKRLTEHHLPELVVLSLNEVTRDTRVIPAGTVVEPSNGVRGPQRLAPTGTND
jgi:flagellar biosynthesis protein FlhA